MQKLSSREGSPHDRPAQSIYPKLEWVFNEQEGANWRSRIEALLDQIEHHGNGLLITVDTLKKTITSAGKSITDEALRLAVDAVNGFAHMLQLVGYFTWEEAWDGPTIDVQCQLSSQLQPPTASSPPAPL